MSHGVEEGLLGFRHLDVWRPSVRYTGRRLDVVRSIGKKVKMENVGRDLVRSGIVRIRASRTQLRRHDPDRLALEEHCQH